MDVSWFNLADIFFWFPCSPSHFIPRLCTACGSLLGANVASGYDVFDKVAFWAFSYLVFGLVLFEWIYFFLKLY